MTKKRNFFQKLYLKFTNPIEYCYQYENLQQIIENIQIKANIESNNIAREHSDEYIKEFVIQTEKKYLQQLEEVIEDFETTIPHLRKGTTYHKLYEDYGNLIASVQKQEKKTQNIKHSGHLGDLIYSLPTLISLANNKKVNLHINITKQNVYQQTQGHFSGENMLNKKSFEMLFPLLNSQKYIQNIEIFDETIHNIDYDFDIFREMPIFLNRGNISNWYFYIFGGYYNLSIPWLEVTPNHVYKDEIVLARTKRYNNPCIDYGFLKKYNNITFIGLENEYENMRENIPDLKYQPVNDFLEMAQIIAGCKFFIGNQSFPYSLAEALKVPRLLEVFYQNPNVIPQGNNGFDFYFQYHFEKLVDKLNNG